MQFTGAEIISLAKTFVDDDHEANDGWIAPSTWLRFVNWEYMALYRRGVRFGVLRPTSTDTSFSGHSVILTRALAVVGVARDLGGGRISQLDYEQGNGVRTSFWGTSGTLGTSSVFTVEGTGDDARIELYPRDDAGNYVARWIVLPPYLASVTDVTEDLPSGAEAALAYGVASQALIKDQTTSSMLRGKAVEVMEQLGFIAGNRTGDGGPRIRNLRLERMNRASFPDCSRYVYL